MIKENISIERNYLINGATGACELEFGKSYIMFSSKFKIQEQLFKDYKPQISFINSPFKEALKVPKYFEANSKKLILINEQIENLNFIPFSIDHSSYFGKIILVLFSELNKKDIAVVETTGLANDSIFKLLTFNLNMLKLFPEKLIVTIDFNFVDTEKIWIHSMDYVEPLEDILYTIPLDIRKLDHYPYNSTQK